MLSSLYSFLDAQREKVIHWQRELTARPALGPENNGAGEEEKAAWLVRELENLGFSDILYFPCPDERVPSGFRPNIAARLSGKRKQTLWVISHLDVVPPGEERLWKSPPFTLRVEGDMVYGRGVEDNQQAIATSLLAAGALLEKGVTPDYSLGLLFVADEETGMTRGLPHVLATAPELIHEDDLILVPDMGNNTGAMVEVAEKSCLWLRFTVHGRQCHASTPHMGVNSLVAASACVLALEELYRIFRAKDALFDPAWSTFVPSKKEANVENINTLPGRDVFYLDCRVLPEYELARVEAECRRIADEVAGRYRTSIDIDIVHKEQAASGTPESAPVVSGLLGALRELRGLSGIICGAGGQTVASCLRKRGKNVVVWSTLIPNPHTPNERSSITNTIDDAKVVLRMLFEHPFAG